jgi:hypothetical protein
VLLSSKFFGSVNEWTVRLSAVLGGLGFVLTIYMIGKEFHLEREVMPVLGSPAEVEMLLRSAPTSYMLIKDLDLKKLALIAPQPTALSDSAVSTD